MNSGFETLGELVERNADKGRDRVALIYNDQTFTFDRHRDRVRRLANGLFRRGMRRQSRVAVLAQNSNSYIEIYAAAEMAGYITVAVNYRLAVAEIAYILRDSSPAVLIFDAEYSDTVAQIRQQLPEIGYFIAIGVDHPDWAESYEVVLESSSNESPASRARPSDIAYLIYTSGTTGRPKGAMLDHAGQVGFIQMQAAEMRMHQDDRMLLMMPFYHIGAKCNYLVSSLAGARVVLHRSYGIEAIARDIEAHRITVVHLAPIMVQDLLELGSKSDYSSLRLIQYASGPMAIAQLRRAVTMFGPILLQVYGMTETGLGTVLHPSQHVLEGPEQWVRRLGSAGQEARGYRVRVVRPDGTDCEIEERGEILIKGPGVMVGYWNNHPATIAAIDDGWMRSGDIGLFDEDRFLFVLDRKKDMIISGGENIYPREIEEAIYSHPSVNGVAVIGVPDQRWGESVKAFVVLSPGKTATDVEIIEHCKARLASYKKPKSVDFVASLPRLPNKKIDKKALRAAYWKGYARQVN